MTSSSSAALRIGLVTPAWPGTRTPNGIASAVVHIAAGLESEGHEVTILPHAVDAAHDHPRVVALAPTRLTVTDRLRRRLTPDSWLQGEMARRHVEAIRQAQSRHGLEIVVMEETQGWIGQIRDQVSIPIVATLHGPWWLHRTTGSAAGDAGSARREAREVVGLRRADGITAPSQDVLRRTEELWGLPDCPKVVIGNPMPLPGSALELTPDLLDRVLFVGRFDHIKGGDVVLDAFTQVAAASPGCRLTFAGPDIGLLRGDGGLWRIAEYLAGMPEELRSRVDVVGVQSRDEVAALRQAHGITVVASRYETFGGTVVEAMAAGSAVVCTRVGGCQEIVDHGRTGLLVPSEDAAAMASACLRLMQEPGLAMKLGSAARRHVGDALAPATIGRQMADFLRPICRR